MTASYKAKKEAFVSNLSGGTLNTLAESCVGVSGGSGIMNLCVS